ncbi:hypothetical protein [Polymorphum gilvum]|uniref:Uncharacterized protein n=1 Tax=Polymorphum gilvum (strain LMG 25793 / CGMCC 1.9160 / SL003B-26A1) TaxID=991905 RepID=F2IZ43_POLGS|nr:hypothetical protein [Polymorphum gilvum]ADZ71766.1 hypothetical protein SL003B_3344 [Polymorphum gilvum SL003B-26A1]
MTRNFIVTLIATAGLAALVGTAHAQSAGQGAGQGNGGGRGGSSSASGDSGGGSGPILCASRACMDRQAAAAAGTPPTHNTPPRGKIRYRMVERDTCRMDYLVLDNGPVIQVRDCYRPERVVR